MGLRSSSSKQPKVARAVAQYVIEHDPRWERWLQTSRVELNAMTTPELIEWLDRKMAEHGSGKLIPPHDVLEQDFAVQVERILREDLTADILRAANLDGQVAEALAAIRKPSGSKLAKGIERMFKKVPDAEWRVHIEDVARKMAD
jgi:hypothetical protein